MVFGSRLWGQTEHFQSSTCNILLHDITKSYMQYFAVKLVMLVLSATRSGNIWPLLPSNYKSKPGHRKRQTKKPHRWMQQIWQVSWQPLKSVHVCAMVRTTKTVTWPENLIKVSQLVLHFLHPFLFKWSGSWRPEGNTAIHLQRLRPAFIFVGVFVVFHKLRGNKK